MRKKKVLIVIARLNRGGTAKYIGELVPGLLANGLEVLIATGFVQGSEVEDAIVANLPIVRIESLGRKMSFKADLKARQELKRVIKNFSPDLIYSHTFKAGLLTRTIFNSIPKVHAYHGHIFEDREHSEVTRMIYKLIESFLSLRTTLIVTIGEKIGKDLSEAHIGRFEKIVSIPPGINPITLPSAKVAIKKFNLEPDKVTVSWLGRLEEVKKPTRVIELAQRLPHVQFVIAGEGSQGTQLIEKQLKNVKLLGWQDATDVFAVSDIVINTSLSEGMSLSLIEAQFAGKPAVAMDVGSNSEIIKNGVTGYISKDFPEPYLSYLKRLIDNPDLRIKMAHSARVWAISQFSTQALIQNHLNIFKRAI